MLLAARESCKVRAVWEAHAFRAGDRHGSPCVEGVAYFTYTVPTGKSYNGSKITLKFSIKYPDETERVMPQQYQYICDYTHAALNAVFRITKGNGRDYWDEDSLIDYFIANQWGSKDEVSWKSVFLYKPYGEKLCSGPVWNFD